MSVMHKGTFCTTTIIRKKRGKNTGVRTRSLPVTWLPVPITWLPVTSFPVRAACGDVTSGSSSSLLLKCSFDCPYMLLLSLPMFVWAYIVCAILKKLPGINWAEKSIFICVESINYVDCVNLFCVHVHIITWDYRNKLMEVSSVQFVTHISDWTCKLHVFIRILLTWTDGT